MSLCSGEPPQPVPLGDLSLVLGATVGPVSSVFLWILEEELIFQFVQFLICCSDRVEASKLLTCGTRKKSKLHCIFLILKIF